MGTAYNPTIVTDGLVLCLDAANNRSYPKCWYYVDQILQNGNNGSVELMDLRLMHWKWWRYCRLMELMILYG